MFSFSQLKTVKEVVIMGYQYGQYAGYGGCHKPVAPIRPAFGGFTLIVVLFILLVIVGAGALLGPTAPPPVV